MQKKIPLWSNAESISSSITRFPVRGTKARPTVLVIPGGGYGCVCENTEGSPIARKFNEFGFHAFVLDYRVAPNGFPAPQQDALRAMRLIRANAEKWHVIPNRIAVCGFSAGSHLAASLGTISQSVPALTADAVDAENGVPDAMILGYGVLSFAPWSETGTRRNFLGPNPSDETVRLGSLENQVSDSTPPAFLWHTIGDQVVNFRNSVVFAEAMAAHHRPCELHLFPYGDHGMLLGLGTDDVVQWPSLAVNFLKTQWKTELDPEEMRKHYTNRFQAEQEKLQPRE